MKQFKSYKIRLYPNETQKIQIDKTINSCRFLYNQMLSERIDAYDLLKNDKFLLKRYKNKTEKQYKSVSLFAPLL